MKAVFPQNGRSFIGLGAKQALKTAPWNYILFYLYHPYVQLLTACWHKLFQTYLNQKRLIYSPL